jgi:DnaK suppressor protein
VDDELTDAQLAEITADLVAAQTELITTLQSLAEGAKPVDLDAPIGRLSRMDAMQQQQMTKASKRAAQIRSDLVRSALSALADDRYGECRRCEELIGYGRLKARPESAFCLACQTVLESR